MHLLVTSGNITAAKKLLSISKLSLQGEAQLTDLLRESSNKYQQYYIISFILDTYPNLFDPEYFMLSNDSAMRLLSDTRLSEGVKDEILHNQLNVREVTPDEFNQMIGTYRKIVDVQFLTNVMESIAGSKSGNNIMKYILKTYRPAFTANDIENIYGELHERDVNDEEAMYILFNQPQMKEKYGDI